MPLKKYLSVESCHCEITWRMDHLSSYTVSVCTVNISSITNTSNFSLWECTKKVVKNIKVMFVWFIGWVF